MISKDKLHILNELEKFHLGKLDAIRAKREMATLDGPRQCVVEGAVNLTIDPSRKELVVTCGK